MRADQIWQAALGELQLQMTKATFDTWVKNTHVISMRTEPLSLVSTMPSPKTGWRTAC